MYWIGGTFALAIGLLGVSCGYDNMIGVEMYSDENATTGTTGQRFIIYPSTKNTFTNTGASYMVVLSHVLGYGYVDGSVLNGTEVNDGHQPYLYITNTPGTQTLLNSDSANNLPACRFFIVNDGWTKWVNNRPILEDHIFYIDNVSGTDTGHADYHTGSYVTDTTNTSLITKCMMRVGIEDSHKTDESMNRYGVVADQDYHDLYLEVDYISTALLAPPPPPP
jgi:hypothetical protein